MEKALASHGSDFDRLISLVKTLRGEHGCPWDRAQTPETIKMYLVEEAYEVLEAIDSGRDKGVCEELGDLLFQILLLARIFEESGVFETKDVVRGVTEKMIRRHPHVFSNVQVSCAREVRERWHAMKMMEAEEKNANGGNMLDSVPERLPALMRAYRLGQRASMAGFDRQDLGSTLIRVEKGLDQLKAAIKENDQQGLLEGFGDLLFAMTDVGRLMGVHPESALVQAISRFVARFKIVEEVVSQQGRTLKSVSHAEMAAIWEASRNDKHSKETEGSS